MIVDDGSTEDVKSYIEQYADPRIVFICQENQGNAVARNTGFHRSTGEFVAFLDSDDLWHPSTLEKMISVMLSRQELDVVYSRFGCIDGDGNPIVRKKGPLPVRGDLLVALLLGHPIPPSSALIKRLAFEKWGGFKPGLDDWGLWLRWAVRGCRFEGVAEPYISYRMHAQNFNLDWEKRSKVHFDMLDAFYQLEDLPPVALQVRDQAYARQHFHFAVLAWQVGRPADGVKEFIRAVYEWPIYLQDLDFFTQVACAHQDWAERGSSAHFDFNLGRKTLFEALNTLFEEPVLPQAILSRCASAFGWAYFVLARLAYTHLQDMNLTRRCLHQSVAAWPAMIVRIDWPLWLMRSLVGAKNIQAMKKSFGSVRSTVESLPKG